MREPAKGRGASPAGERATPTRWQRTRAGAALTSATLRNVHGGRQRRRRAEVQVQTDRRAETSWGTWRAATAGWLASCWLAGLAGHRAHARRQRPCVWWAPRAESRAASFLARSTLCKAAAKAHGAGVLRVGCPPGKRRHAAGFRCAANAQGARRHCPHLGGAAALGASRWLLSLAFLATAIPIVTRIYFFSITACEREQAQPNHSASKVGRCS